MKSQIFLLCEKDSAQLETRIMYVTMLLGMQHSETHTVGRSELFVVPEAR